MAGRATERIGQAGQTQHCDSPRNPEPTRYAHALKKQPCTIHQDIKLYVMVESAEIFDSMNISTSVCLGNASRFLCCLPELARFLRYLTVFLQKICASRWMESHPLCKVCPVMKWPPSGKARRLLAQRPT